MSERIGRRQILELGLKAPLVLLATRLRPGQPEVGADIPEGLALNERVTEILSLIEPLSFDSQGNLVKETPKGELEKVTAIPTVYSQETTEKVEEVSLLVVHYDGNDRFWQFDDYQVERHAESVVWLLDRNGYSAHWCVDGFPIGNRTKGVESGYGVLQTQQASGDAALPLIGAHVKMKLEDANKLKTVDVFARLRITSNLHSLYNRQIESFNFHTVGFEQVGTEFDAGFPTKNQPDNQQIANALSLTIAVIKQHSLTAWDVVGHHEVQELKLDPGDYYMATLRFLLGVAAIKGEIPNHQVFTGYDGAPDKEAYFKKVYGYLSERKNGWLWHWKDLVGFDEFMKSLSTSVSKKERDHKWR